MSYRYSRVRFWLYWSCMTFELIKWSKIFYYVLAINSSLFYHVKRTKEHVCLCGRYESKKIQVMDHFYLSVCVKLIFKCDGVRKKSVFYIRAENRNRKLERERKKLLHKSSARGFMCFKLN